MHRRSVLRSLLLVPGAVALPAALPAQEPARPSPAANPAPSETPLTPTVNADSYADAFVRTFTPEQFAALKKLGELIVPSSEDSPGTDQAKAAEFLDFLIGQSPADRMQLYRTGLDSLNSEAHGRYQKPFADVTASEAEPILAPLRQAWSFTPPTATAARFLLAAKSDLLEATRNSREYIEVVSRRRRGASGSGQYWYAVDRDA
jgi:Gluconate 2-dehydrogenase subunit 3